MMADDSFVIVADSIDNTQRSLMHGWIKSQTDEWWHQLPDAWVVVGEDISFWRDGLMKFMLDDSKLLVLALKKTTGGRWATHRVTNTAWFHEHLPPRSKKPPSVDIPDSPK